MKIVALLAFRNEEEFLRHNLPQLKQICDVILGHDDDSTDKSKEIFSKFGGVILPHSRTLQWGNGGEFQVRDALLRAGRGIGGTHFICLDADELFTSDTYDDLHSSISELSPGSALSFRWISCWEDPSDGKLAYEPHAMIYKDFIFADKAGLEYPNGLLHIPRTPTDSESHVQSASNGGVLHLQNFNYANFIAKQLWYQLSEVVFSGHPYYYLDQKYPTYSKKYENLVALNPIWFEDLPRMVSRVSVSTHRRQEIIDMLHACERGKIEHLGLWGNEDMRTIYREFYGVFPRRKTLIRALFDIIRLQIFTSRSRFARWRSQNFK